VPPKVKPDDDRRATKAPSYVAIYTSRRASIELVAMNGRLTEHDVGGRWVALQA